REFALSERRERRLPRIDEPALADPRPVFHSSRTALLPTDVAIPITRRLVVGERLFSEVEATLTRELVDRASRCGLQLLLGVAHHVCVADFVIVQRRPRDRVVLLGHAEKSAESHYGEQDRARLLVEHDIFDLSDLAARGVSHRCADDFLRANG